MKYTEADHVYVSNTLRSELANIFLEFTDKLLMEKVKAEQESAKNIMETALMVVKNFIGMEIEALCFRLMLLSQDNSIIAGAYSDIMKLVILINHD